MRVAVVGAGPAGLVAALATRRLGFPVVVFERAADFSRVGSAVGIQANGRQVLDALGLLDSFGAMQTLHRGTLHAPPGRILSNVDLREVDIPFAGFAVVLRHDLQQHLLEAARADGVDLRFGAQCTLAERDGCAALLRFADGSTHRADIVLGCDGVHSAVRESLGMAVQKTTVGEAYLRGVSREPVRDPLYVGELWGDDARRFGMFPIGSGGTYFFCSVEPGRWIDTREHGLGTWIESWRGFGDDVMRILGGVEDWRSVNYDELKEVRLPRWCAPPFFLVGDAAHAMTPNLGQGANSAMVDALVLARVLRETVDAGGSPEDAAARYEQVRLRFVTRLQTQARMAGRMAAWTWPPARAMRAALIRASAAIGPARRRSLLIVAGYNEAEQPYLSSRLAPS